MRPRPAPFAWLAAGAAAGIALGAAAPALAGSQSSKSSSNCYNGHCTRVETFETERGGVRRGWTRIERRDDGRRDRPWRGRYDRRHEGGAPFWPDAPRRHRRGERDG